ncbi:elongation factor TS-domain-containing protein [Cristinia sonorae]|uniref:Elongation factor Ts, mitochondrial n=1 Tax=Cristinia sonorae TaxID=1940300 RepID=A0A8K0URR2_9AGAR|nr:elongation factor TS-domain-containing protein [Cristinia sonorae]
MSQMLLIRPSTSLRTTAPRTARQYSSPTSSQQKPSIKLIAELRKHTDVSLPLARDALTASNNSIPDALAWLAKHGEKKASKVEGRATNEGLVGVYTISNGVNSTMRAPVWAGMVEMNCETDFVARGELFGKLLSEVAHSAAFHSKVLHAKQVRKQELGEALIKPVDVEALLEAPLLPYGHVEAGGKQMSTVSQSLRTLMGKVGENISIRRAAVVRQDIMQRKDVGFRLASYGHGGTFTSHSKFQSGRIATLAIMALKAPPSSTSSFTNLSHLLRGREGIVGELETLEAALARQIAGFPTTSIASDAEGDESALYSQLFMMYPEGKGASVRAVLSTWETKNGFVEKGKEETGSALEVLEFLKWTVGGESVAAGKL